MGDTLKVGLAQIAPVWLNRVKTLEKVATYIQQAVAEACRLVVFGEALVPGYPFWIELTDGARFDSPAQKEMHAYYMSQAVQIETGDLDAICRLASAHKIAVVLGCIERAADRGGHSLYCALAYIDTDGRIASVHRKLMPTYEERLTWSPGDGHGLRVHALGAFTVGGLNCWENWMPLVRSALYAQGEDLHVAIWPGGLHNTEDITRFIAREARSYVLSVSGLMRKDDIDAGVPAIGQIRANADDVMANGGSCLAGPDGQWILEPQVNTEGLFTATLDHRLVRSERQNFDPSGHYSRPDVTRLVLNRKRQGVLEIKA